MSSDTRTVDHNKLDFTRWLLANEPFQKWFLKRAPEIASGINHIPSLTAKTYLDAIFANQNLAQSAWLTWGKQELGIDFENTANKEHQPLLLDAKGAEMLGVSRLEYVSRVQIARESVAIEKMMPSEKAHYINQMAESVVVIMEILDRHEVIRIEDGDGKGAGIGQFTTYSDFWNLRASAACESALFDGLVLSRVATDTHEGMSQEITWSVGSIYTPRKGHSDIRVNEIHAEREKGGSGMMGTNYYCGNRLLKVDAESFDAVKNGGESLLLRETRSTLSAFQDMVKSAVDLSEKVAQSYASTSTKDPLTQTQLNTTTAPKLG